MYLFRHEQSSPMNSLYRNICFPFLVLQIAHISSNTCTRLSLSQQQKCPIRKCVIYCCPSPSCFSSALSSSASARLDALLAFQAEHTSCLPLLLLPSVWDMLLQVYLCQS